MFSCLNWWYALIEGQLRQLRRLGLELSMGTFAASVYRVSSQAKMEVSWNGGTPKSSILDSDFPLTNHFGDPPFMETPMLPATGFLTSYQPQYHQTRCSTAKVAGSSKGSVVKSSVQISNFRFLPKVQVLPNFRYFQISGTSLLDHGEVQCSFLQKSGCQKMMEAPHIH